MTSHNTNVVAIVCVHYKSEHLFATIRSIKDLGKSVSIQKTIFVANDSESWAALNEAEARLLRPATILQHDNSGMEFGGYQLGLDTLLGELDPDWVVFANDTFATHHSFGSIERQKLAAELGRKYEHPAIIGQVVSWPRAFQIEGLRTHRWMTTNVFALNRPALRALNSRIYRPLIDELVTDTDDMLQFFPAHVDPVLREHLEAWLFRARPGWHWYASGPLLPANSARMARKARSIMQEKYLAALMDDLGAEFVDTNDLSIYKKVVREFDRKWFAWKRKRLPAFR